MGTPSSPSFRTVHALRLKGSATVPILSDMTRATPSVVEQQLEMLTSAGLAEAGGAPAHWRLTPAGRTSHDDALRAEVDDVLPNAEFDQAWERFVALDAQFQQLFDAWHVFNGQPNDHSSAEYDAAVIENLSHLHTAAEPTVRTFGAVLERMGGYGPRLESVLVRILDGESNMFTGVMCGSYHDVWMELHEDLILTQGLERSTGGRR